MLFFFAAGNGEKGNNCRNSHQQKSRRHQKDINAVVGDLRCYIGANFSLTTDKYRHYSDEKNNNWQNYFCPRFHITIITIVFQQCNRHFKIGILKY